MVKQLFNEVFKDDTIGCSLKHVCKKDAIMCIPGKDLVPDTELSGQVSSPGETTQSI